MFFVTFPLTVSASVGAGTWWDGIVTVGNTSQVHSFYVTDVELVGMNYNAVYKGDFNTYVDVESYDTDVFLNGYLRKRINLTFSDNGLGYISSPQVYCEPIVMDGITASVSMVSSQDFSVSFDILLSFNNYYVSQSSFRIPLLITVMSSQQFLAGADWGSVVRVYSNLDQVEDWYGDMWQYDNLEDVPSVDGYISNQNQTIIDQSQTQIENQEIQNQLQEQQNQLQQESNEQNKNFMDNFFSNLGNTVLGWIVPSSEDLTGFLDDVNSWFSDRLGFVWYPFDLAYQLVSAFTQGEPDSMFKVPGFTMNFQGQQLQIWQPLEVDIDAFDIFKYVRYFTSALLACGVAALAINKWDEWIGGHS